MGKDQASAEVESVAFFSLTLLRGCAQFAQRAKIESDVDRIIELNAACVMFAAAYIEAMLNEQLTLVTEVENDRTPPRAYWESLCRLERDLRVADKWNLIASVSGGVVWDSGTQPFQFFDDIVSLRNELVHYKGKFLTVGNAPSNRLSRLAEKFDLPWGHVVGDDPKVTPWVLKLLYNEKLSEWIAEQTHEFQGNWRKLLWGEG